MGPGGIPRLMREPQIECIDDGPGKPVGINKFIGRRPIAAFRNSDGDLEMLQWTTAGTGGRFGSLADLANAFSVIERIRLTPLSFSQMVVLVAAAALPMLPLVLFAIPIDELIVRGAKGLLGL